MTPDEMTTTLAELLAVHSDCITNCDIKTDGVRDGQMWYVIHWTCGMTSGPMTLGNVPIREDHRAHLAAVLAATVTEAQAGALREAADDLPNQDASFPVYEWRRGIQHLVENRRLTTWLRARADSLVDRAERGQG